MEDGRSIVQPEPANDSEDYNPDEDDDDTMQNLALISGGSNETPTVCAFNFSYDFESSR